MKCCICEEEIDVQRHPDTGEVMWDQGHNAQPVRNGRCCSTCNYTIVLAARINDLRNRHCDGPNKRVVN